MHILVICHYFYPEISAPSARLYEMGRTWVELGHQVTVVTCFPNHPHGRIPKEYRGKSFIKESLDGMTILRNFVFAAPNQGVFKKTLGHLSFMCSSLLLSTIPCGHPDVILVSSPTFFSVYTALALSKIKSCPFIFEVRDLWPAIFVDLGVIRNRHIIRILEQQELFLYRAAGRVVTVTESFAQDIVKRGIPASKVAVITNGVDVDRFSPGPIDQELRSELGLEGKFVVSYLGAHGISHGLDAVLRMAERLKGYDDIRVLMVGDGAMKQTLAAARERLGLDKVLMLPGQPREMMPRFYRASDVLLVPLRDIPLFDTFIPSKMFEIMACGRPILGSVRGEARRILERSQAAIITDPEDVDQMTAGVLRLYQDRDLGLELGRNGRQFVSARYARPQLAADYLRLLEATVAETKR
ncbi:MAG: glycosyltransferase family 4 protein [Deltaproteobacteria bacterium]|nr:glycosyltransferase family 4 protein [Deltaproteobacteria bacterium]